MTIEHSTEIRFSLSPDRELALTSAHGRVHADRNHESVDSGGWQRDLPDPPTCSI